MADLEELKKQAKRKVEAEMTEPDSPLGQIGMMCITWIDYADNAAELILTEGKTLAGALGEMRKYAAKVKNGNAACVDPVKAMELVLEYFCQPDPKAIIEGGLMYKCMMDAAARFKPYEATVPVDVEIKPMEPAPVQEVPAQSKPQPGADLMAALNALSLED